MEAQMTGSIVLATDQGLGYLAKDFYDHGIIHKVFIQKHSSRKTHTDWYRPEDIVSDPEELLKCDSLLFFEQVFHWNIIPKARERGVKTVLMPMYECTQFPFPYEPDLVLCPSKLDLRYYEEKNATFVPVPVSVPWRLRKKARVFVHNAGNLGLGGRNGTKEVIEAMKYVKSPIKLILRSQEPIYVQPDPRITLETGQLPFHTLWEKGDVFLFPEKFNGLSLPLQEAYASGMLVMCGNRFPMNTWLPNEPLIPVHHYTKEKIAVEFDCAHYDPKEIARCIDSWYGKDISEFSTGGKTWAEQNSWEKLKPLYEACLQTS